MFARLHARPLAQGARQRQRGAVIVTVALVLLFLLGFIGFALDFGRLFVVKTELQTAMDACALAAAQELDGGSDALTRATSAGLTAGNLNKAHFQSSAAGLAAADIRFSDALNGSYSSTFPFATAKYAKCEHTRSGMLPWLLQAMGAATGESGYGASQSVWALAVATRAHAQTACAIPVQINPKNSSPPNYGFVPGEWIPSLYDEGQNSTAPTPGHFGWANLDSSASANATKDELTGSGHCNLRTGATVNTPGAKVAASVAWNSRFGLYKNGAGNPSVQTAAPDLTGYAYTPSDTGGNWTKNTSTVADFLARRAGFRSYGDTVDTVNAGDAITKLNIKGGYKNSEMATHAAGPRALATWGTNRRLVLAPFVVGSKIADWACVLMLHPIDSVKTTVYLEYVGNAAAASSPCTSVGLAGGANGPLVPVLVQ